YYYYLEISLNGSGCSGIISDVAEIIVVDDPVITTQPLATQTLCQGIAPQTLEAMVSGGLGSNYNYQWYGNTSNSNTGGSIISGETNSSFIPPTDTVGSFYYYVEITQPGAGCSVVSDVAEVNVNAAPNITPQPI